MDGSMVFAIRRQCAPHAIYASLGQPESTTQTASWLVPPSSTWFLGPPESSTQTASRPVHLFCTDHCSVFWYFTMGHLSPIKIAPSHGCKWTPSLGASVPTAQTASQLVQPFLQGSLLRQMDRLTDRQTDRPRYSVSSNWPHLRT